jgi:Glycosyl transferase family 11
MSSLVVRLVGGLGNQLFIYATARAIAERTGAVLIVDTESGFLHDSYKRQYGLNHFNIHAKKANRLQSFTFWGGRACRKILKIFNAKSLLHNYIVEKNYEKFDPAMTKLHLSQLTWIEGYWQTEQYFLDIKNILTKELVIQSELSAETIALGNTMQNNVAVGLHIRQLRNILVGEENANIKTVPLAYYTDNMQQIIVQYPNAHFYCFSDDPDTAKSLLQGQYPITFITHNKGDELAHEDFWLMQQCQHFIISNSTFSWWAAWLGSHTNKIVYAPALQYWDCKEIIPSSWTIES